MNAQPQVAGAVMKSSPRRRRRPSGRIWIRIAPLLVLAGIWVYLSEVQKVDPLFLPSPGDLVHRFNVMRPQLPSATFYSLRVILGGFAIGCTSGILVGLGMAFSRTFREASEWIINAIRPVPIFALIPIFLLWFGIGMTSQLLLVAFGCFVILVVSTAEAIKNVPQIYVRAAQTLGASRIRLYRTVIVPAIVPELIGAIRVAAAASFGLDVAAELIGAQNGLGHLMINSQLYLQTDGIVVIIVIFSLLAFLLDRLILAVSGRLTAWSGR